MSPSTQGSTAPQGLNPRPVLVLQPQADDGPAYLATWLQAHGVAAQHCRIAAGDAVPARAQAFRAIAVLGGAMSVNDPLPWLRQAEALLRDAIALGVPVLGHCLGGQLLARALGAAVRDNPVAEIGWHAIHLHDDLLTRAWFGAEADAALASGTPLPVFQWHFQTFDWPEGARALAGSPACPRQAFAIGPHLGLQFHVEVDAAKLDSWADEACVAMSTVYGIPSTETAIALRTGTAAHLARSQRLAGAVYRRWLGL